MMRKSGLSVLWLVFAFTGCVASIVPIADSSVTDDTLGGIWMGCEGTKIEVTRPGANQLSEGYAMRVTDRKTRKAATYRLFIQRIGDEEFADVFYAPPESKVGEFPAVHMLALIRHDKNDVLFGPLNDDWWNVEHLKGSGLQVVDIGNYEKLVLGTSSDLRTFLGAHAYEPDVFLTADEYKPNYGRLKRQWTNLEAKGCSEEL